ncbi:MULTISPECIES: hypothetical protein [Brucella]|jgi:hypothetical protein|uniref:Uncharacterized protein n=3 Tax=Brucella TaxID=234 RepID=A6X6Y5_BRUA4|nr:MULTISPECIES: hypothetical protein [Brucella]ABS16989.1 hypothetical protein Oant_4289 [Brucella anthropi ATCC 49188]AIK41820.1 hypothetical protein DR92_3957 [Brucella anthropi]EXL03573.1 hypothetical protein BG46_04025 [Brucella anthropi]KIU69439.1 hypothetical protein TR92_06085 [Brucella anthropi]MBA8861371.1 hypothetical protein [Brucella anthropi]
MMKTVPPDKSSGARARGAIQRGEAGDKVPGFDPAVAPMETDAEAGGSAQPAEDHGTRPLAAPVKPDDSNASSHASGLRAWPPKENARSARKTTQMREGPAYMVWWFIIAVVVIGYFIVSWMWS